MKKIKKRLNKDIETGKIIKCSFNRIIRRLQVNRKFNEQKIEDWLNG